MKVAIIGSGAWGTAIATVLAHNHHDVVMWTHEEDVVQAINEQHENTHYLPGVALHHGIKATTNKEEALKDVVWVFEAIPVKFMRTVINEFVQYYTPEQKWVVLSKGIEKDTCLLPAHIMQELLGVDAHIAVLAGPSFAIEVTAQQLTSVSVASKDLLLCKELEELLETDYFRLNATDDVRGVQICAALKNVVALGMGILEGLMCEDNTKALFFAKMYQTIRSFVMQAGGLAITTEEPAGLGDLVLTAFGSHSRNLAAGKAFVIGEDAPHARAVPESFNTVVSFNQILEGTLSWQGASSLDGDFLLFKALYCVVTQKKEPAHLLEMLAQVA